MSMYVLIHKLGVKIYGKNMLEPIYEQNKLLLVLIAYNYVLL